MEGPGAARPAPWPRYAVVAAVGAVGLHLVLLHLLPPGTARVVDEVDQTLAAGAATVAAWWAARRRVTTGPRRAWYLIAGALTSAFVGQATYTVVVLVLGWDDPFPSPADVGYVVAFALGLAALLVWSAHRRRRADPVRDLLDGGIVAGSLLALFWALVPEPSWVGSASGLTYVVLTTVYPLFDVALATTAILTTARATGAARVPLALFSLAFLSLAAGDLLYLRATQLETFDSGDPLSTFWVAAHGFAALACLWPARADVRTARSRETWPRLALPYVPLAVTVPVLVGQATAGRGLSDRTLWVVTVLFALVLARQLVTLLDNQRLVVALRHDAETDALTGIANRRAVEAAVTSHLGDPLVPGAVPRVAVLAADVNGLKRANDGFGHDAGDAVLLATARTIVEAVRACVDPADALVGRVGGDEFAVVLTGDAVARREDVQREIRGRGRDLPYGTGLSCGSGHLDHVPADVTTPQELMRTLLRLADGELYAHKAPGRSPDRPAGPAAGELAGLVVAVDARLATAGPAVAERLGEVGAAVAAATSGAAWCVSRVSAERTLDDVLSGQVRESTDPAPSRLTSLETTAYPLDHYPASDDAAHGRRAGFHVTRLSGETEERMFLAVAGYAQVVAAGGVDADGTAWLVEVYGDADTGDLSDALPVLQALVLRALRPGPPAVAPVDPRESVRH